MSQSTRDRTRPADFLSDRDRGAQQVSARTLVDKIARCVKAALQRTGSHVGDEGLSQVASDGRSPQLGTWSFEFRGTWLGSVPSGYAPTEGYLPITWLAPFQLR